MNDAKPDAGAPRREGGLRRGLSRWASHTREEARELTQETRKAGLLTIADAPDRSKVVLQGTLKTVTLQPRGGAPALHAELYDGSGSITVVWLGRRRIAGIFPGRAMRVEGRIGVQDGDRIMFNPATSCVRERSAAGAEPVTEATVESVVRAQLSDALGGVRGMLEAAVPTIAFTAVFLTSKDLRLAVLVSVAAAAVLLVVRLVQRSSPQFVLNAFLGIGIGAFFAWRAARSGGDANDQALAYFLPGLLYNAVYSVLMVLSIVVRWPLVGFVVGSVTAKQHEGDPTAWRQDPQVVRLCSRLTWLLVLPCIVRVVVQAPLYLAGRSGALDPSTAVAVLGASKLAMGWPLQVAALGAMVWLLSRNRTPVQPT